MLICKFCKKKFKHLVNHINWCKKNPNIDYKKKKKSFLNTVRSHLPKTINKNNVDWKMIQKKYDSGYSWRDLIKKCKMTDFILCWAVKNKKLKLRNTSDGVKLAWKNKKFKVSTYQTKEFRKKCSKNGGYKGNSNAGKCKTVRYHSKIAGHVYLQGTWEVKYAKYLDENKINWKRNLKSFKYNFKGKILRYYPDFYLVDTDEYIEIKGYIREKDSYKWKDFPHKLTVLMKKDLKKLGIKI